MAPEKTKLFITYRANFLLIVSEPKIRDGREFGVLDLQIVWLEVCVLHRCDEG